MGLGPDVWGPYGWKFFHFIALGYPKNPTEEDKINYKTFFTLVPSILPCSICSNHYANNLKKYPITDEILSDRINLFNWTVDMHNEVNISNDKKIIDYDTALKLIINNFNSTNVDEHQITHKNIPKIKHTQKNFKNKNKNENIDYTKYIVLFIVLVIIIGYLYYTKNKNKTI